MKIGTNKVNKALLRGQNIGDPPHIFRRSRSQPHHQRPWTKKLTDRQYRRPRETIMKQVPPLRQ